MMKTYLIMIIVMLVWFVIYSIINKEWYKAKEGSKYEKIIYNIRKSLILVAIILFVVFSICNIYIYKMRYSMQTDMLAIMYFIMAPAFIIASILNKIKFKYLDTIRVWSSYLIFAVGFICMLGYLLCGFMLFDIENPVAIENTERKYKVHSSNIEIVEMEAVPYTSISGSRYYIRSAPSIAYYYDIETNNGNHTTKILDGNKYYVEKDEDNEYINNPHIKVYEIVREYTNLFGEEKKDVISYEYTICVPENSIFYEK